MSKIEKILGFDIYPPNMNGDVPAVGSGFPTTMNEWLPYYQRSPNCIYGTSSNPDHAFGEGDLKRRSLYLKPDRLTDTGCLVPRFLPWRGGRAKTYVRHCFGQRFRINYSTNFAYSHWFYLFGLLVGRDVSQTYYSAPNDLKFFFRPSNRTINYGSYTGAHDVIFEFELGEEYYIELQVDTNNSTANKVTRVKMFIDGEEFFSKQIFSGSNWNELQDLALGAWMGKIEGFNIAAGDIEMMFADFYAAFDTADEYSDLTLTPLGPQIVMPLRVKSAVGNGWFENTQDPVDILSIDNFGNDGEYLTIPGDNSPLEVKFDIKGDVAQVNGLQLFHRSRKYGAKTQKIEVNLKDDQGDLLLTQDDIANDTKSFKNYWNPAYDLSLPANELNDSKLTLTPKPLNEN